MLDVQVVHLFIPQIQQQTGVPPVLSCSVDLQLHSEEPGTFPVEDRGGLVVVVVDGISSGPRFVAAGTERILGILVRIIVTGVGLVGQRSASAAVEIVVVTTGLAQGDGLCPRVVRPPDPHPAATAEHCLLLQALRTQQPPVKGPDLFRGARSPADRAAFLLFHIHYLHVFLTPMASGSFMEIISN